MRTTALVLAMTVTPDRHPDDDRTTTLYGHLTHDGAAVSIGDRVAQGALLGFSGNTGNTGNKPHLHLSAASCDPGALGTNNCPTLAVNFRNTEPNPRGLERGRSYAAQAY
jgi:murein DD-endopeptidase MepM/ murein hydrolase activator NlpD